MTVEERQRRGPAGQWPGTTETRARAINAEPWEPLPGMAKLRCVACGYWFAAPAAGAKRCPDCEIVTERANSP